MSLQKITDMKRTLWTLAVIMVPPFGALAYNYFAKHRETEQDYGQGFNGAELVAAAAKKE